MKMLGSRSASVLTLKAGYGSILTSKAGSRSRSVLRSIQIRNTGLKDPDPKLLILDLNLSPPLFLTPNSELSFKNVFKRRKFMMIILIILEKF